jgi:hypothetical protein
VFLTFAFPIVDKVRQFLQLSRAFAKKQTLRRDNYITSFEEKVHAEGEKLLREALGRKEDMYGTLMDIPDAVDGLTFSSEDTEETYQSMWKSLQTTVLSLGTTQSDKTGAELSQAISIDRRILPTTHSLYIKSSYIFRLSATLIDTYEGLCKDVAAFSRDLIVGHTWEEDARRVEHTLEGGREIAEERIAEQADKRAARGRQKGMKGEQGGSKSKHEEDGWARAAKRTSKGIQRLAKLLPREK